MRPAIRVTWSSSVVASLGLLGIGLSSIEPSASPPERSHGGRVIACGLSRSADLGWRYAEEPPPWFGDRGAAPVRISGRASGSWQPGMRIHLAIDVPDPAVWHGRWAVIDADGSFDFGAMRPGRYLVSASSRLGVAAPVQVDTTRGSADGVELAIAPCSPYRDVVRANDLQGPDGRGLPHTFLQFAGQTVGVTDATGEFEVCVADPRQLKVVAPRYVDVRHEPYTSANLRALVPARWWTIEVLDADGAAAAGVGVQPIWRGIIGSAWECRPGPKMTTTGAAGLIAMSGLHDLCGVRIFRDGTVYDLDATALVMHDTAPDRGSATVPLKAWMRAQ